MGYELLAGTRAPVRVWTDPYSIEPQAAQQLRNIGALPWVQGVAVMPDVHYGKGATVGSVIAMLQAVSPAAVGVDIGCVDANTEYLSPTGWRRISDYDGGPVMQYEPDTGTGRFVQPAAYIVKSCDEFYRLRTKYGVDQMLTADHRVLCWVITGRRRRRVMTVLTAAEFAARHDRLVQGFKAEFATTFAPEIGTKVELSDDDIRVQVMVNADGYLQAGRRQAVVRVKKERKIDRARDLLTAAGIPFSEHADGNGVTDFRFKPPMATKSYEAFWCASLAQLAVIADECLNWDGNTASSCFYSRDRSAADFIHYAFTATGRRAVLRVDEHQRDGFLDFRVFAHANTMVGMAGVPKTPITVEPSADGKAYCFTVRSGFWVMRRGGNVAMTGNCGMSAVRTSLTAADLPDNLGPLRGAIEDTIPVGFAQRDNAVNTRRIRGVEQGGWDAFWRQFNTLDDGVSKLEGRAHNQMGTLGGGNHFIEVCVEQGGPDDGQVWLMLHSGSRNIGKELAERHMAVARRLPHNAELPDRDLAVFLAGTPQMDAYRRDLWWAQEYARRNRAVMMALLCDVVRQHHPGVVYGEPICCHHNYVAEESYGGVDVLVTRKGAIRAGVGDLGIIPGSMGTGSYIVRGRGNIDAYCSASHGAGRRMSRAQAKKTFTADDLVAQTAGVECRKDAGVVDEIPAAYKDITHVMAQQHDLVEVVAHLKQVVCVKG